jgi:L-threonylcarbamoyladenylate synthase
VAQRLARHAGRAITSTSANVSGRPPTADPDEVAAALPALDILLDGGPAPGGPPSTIVDVTGTVPRLVRSGAVAWERVLESLGSTSTNVP